MAAGAAWPHAAVAAPQTAPAPAAQAAPTTFVILLRGQQIGTETVGVNRTPEGWTISASGNQGPPVNLATRTFVATYSADWQPRSLAIEATFNGEALTIDTTFAMTTARTEVTRGGRSGTAVHEVSAGTIALPNNYFAAYEALAARLAAAPDPVGAKLPIYVVPQAEIPATVRDVTPRRIETPGRAFDMRQFDVAFQNPGGELLVQVWVDSDNRLARVTIPTVGLTAMREEFASVMARLERYSHPRDEDVTIPANGFNIAGTITKPPEAQGRQPVVVLIAGSGPQDRDETVFGIPILGQLAGAISDAGYMTVRYDKRGVGQTGGHPDSASLESYTDDVRSVVEWLRRRDDVDRDRIAVVGHSEGGAVALLAGDRLGGRLKALGLIAAPGYTGRQITLTQQARALAALDEPAASKEAKVALQKQIMDATVTGKGWDEIPEPMRRIADTPWFRSWLTYDPEEVVDDVDQPILIVQGTLDAQVPPDNAHRLESFSVGRGKAPAHTRKIIIPGINHLLVPAKTGEVDEYATLDVKTIDPRVAEAVVAWLGDVMPGRR